MHQRSKLLVHDGSQGRMNKGPKIHQECRRPFYILCIRFEVEGASLADNIMPSSLCGNGSEEQSTPHSRVPTRSNVSHHHLQHFQDLVHQTCIIFVQRTLRLGQNTLRISQDIIQICPLVFPPMHPVYTPRYSSSSETIFSPSSARKLSACRKCKSSIME